MGIPGLFNQFIKDKIKSAIWYKFPVFVSSLAFDLNGVFHEARNKVLGTYTTDKEVLNAILRTPSEQIDLEISLQIRAIIMDVLEKVKPRDSILLCVDGPAPQAKLQQQKIRRQGSILNTKHDSNAITPGTEFMMRLHDDLLLFIEGYKHLLPPKVIYSSHLVPGEGEHKIMDYYRGKEINTGLAAKKGGSHIVYGLDADLIMLTLLSPLPNIFLYRESTEFDKRFQKYVNKTDIININGIKNYLLNKGKNSKNPAVIKDFVVMCFLIGNDFLPRFPGFKDIGKTLVEFVDLYFDNDFTLTLVDEENDPSINWEGLSKFIAILAEQEYSKLFELVRKNDKLKYPSRFIEESIVPNDRGKEIFSYEHYRSNWYNNELGPANDPELIDQLESILGTNIGSVDSNDISKMVKNYLLMISWNYLYYTKGTSEINMDLSYLYHHSPMLRDISAFLDDSLENNNLKISGYKAKDGIIQFTALHQLVAVMPLKSKDLLPVELKPLFSFDSIIRDIFPHQFVIELDGIEKEEQTHLGLSIIPFVDRKRIYDAVFQIQFTVERAKLWLPHKDIKRERSETAEQKQKREIAFEEYKEIKDAARNKKFESEQKNVPLAVKEVPISKENKLILENSKMLSSLGINIGSNTSINRFETNKELPFINNKISITKLISSPKPELTIKNKLMPAPKSELSTFNKLVSRERQEPIARSRDEPITRSRQEPITRSRDEPITKTRDEPITKTRDEPITRSRDEPITRSRQEPITRSRDEPITRSRQEPITRSRDEPITRSRDEPITRSRDEPITRSRDEPITRSRDEPITRTKLEIPTKKTIGKVSLLPVPTAKNVIKKSI